MQLILEVLGEKDSSLRLIAKVRLQLILHYARLSWAMRASSKDCYWHLWIYWNPLSKMRSDFLQLTLCLSQSREIVSSRGQQSIESCDLYHYTYMYLSEMCASPGSSLISRPDPPTPLHRLQGGRLGCLISHQQLGRCLPQTTVKQPFEQLSRRPVCLTTQPMTWPLVTANNMHQRVWWVDTLSGRDKAAGLG